MNKHWQRLVTLLIIVVFSYVFIWRMRQPTVKIEGMTHVIGQPVSNKASVYVHNVEESETVEVDASQFDVTSEQFKQITVVYRGQSLTLPVQFKMPNIADIVTVTTKPQMFVIGGDYRSVFGVPSAYQSLVTYEPAADRLEPGIQDVKVSLYGQTLVQPLHVYDDETRKELVSAYRFGADLHQVIHQFVEKEQVDSTDISVSYRNLVTQREAHVNENSQRVAASTYKLPLALYVEETFSEFGYTLEDKLDVEPYVNESENQEFIGAYGEQVRIADLLSEMIENSSNVASWTLMKQFGGAKTVYEQAFGKYGTQHQSPVATIDYETNESTTGYFLQVLAYLWQYKANYPQVVHHLQNATPNEYYEMLLSDVDIWHKYGSLENELNDVAIVHEKQPYSVALFTQNLTEEQFAKLAFLINEWHRVNEEHPIKNQ